MSDYYLTLGILGAWIYDHLLLIKIKNYLKRKGSDIFWYGIELYHNYKNQLTDEMTKDGYHVDAVFLQEKNKGKGLDHMFDFLRVFRDLIREKKLQEGMTIQEFMKRCCDPRSNFKEFDPNNEYRLYVNYTFDYKSYTVIFNQKVQFPIYSEKEIRDQLLDSGISMAEIVRNPHDTSGIDITHTVKQRAGPLGNFYSDVDYITVKFEDIDSRMPEDDYLRIVDVHGNVWIFDKNSPAIEFKN